MKQRLFLLGKNIVALLLSHVVNRLLYLGLLGLIGRRLGAPGLGGFALASAFGTAFLFATDAGVSHWFTREVAAQPAQADRYYAAASGVKLCASLLALASLALLRTVLPFEPWVVHLCLLMAVAAVLESHSQLNNAVCRTRERMELETFAATTQALVVFGGSLWVLFSDQQPVMLGWAAIAGSTVELAVSAGFARRFVRLGVALPPLWSTMRAAAPYSVASLNAVSFFQVELLVLSLIAGQAAVGEFASVSRLLQGGGYLAVLAGAAILPTLAIAFGRRDLEAFGAIARSAILTSLLAGGAMAAIAVVAAEPVMTLMYGTDFARLAPLLRLGSLYLVLKCIAEALSTLVTASGGQTWSSGVRLVGAASTWVLVAVLTPALGMAGGVLALAAGEVVTGVGQALRVQSLNRRTRLV